MAAVAVSYAGYFWRKGCALFLCFITSESCTFLYVCLTEGVFPDDWKLADVYPVFKSGDSRLFNYRPISVLSILAKVFESLVHQQIYSYFSTNNLLSPAQSGFRPGHSSQDLLIKVTEDWKFALDSDEIVGITFIDLRKAFDSIDHSLLLIKLRAYGFDDVSLR